MLKGSVDGRRREQEGSAANIVASRGVWLTALLEGRLALGNGDIDFAKGWFRGLPGTGCSMLVN